MRIDPQSVGIDLAPVSGSSEPAGIPRLACWRRNLPAPAVPIKRRQWTPISIRTGAGPQAAVC